MKSFWFTFGTLITKLAPVAIIELCENIITFVDSYILNKYKYKQN